MFTHGHAHMSSFANVLVPFLLGTSTLRTRLSSCAKATCHAFSIHAVNQEFEKVSFVYPEIMFGTQIVFSALRRRCWLLTLEIAPSIRLLLVTLRSVPFLSCSILLCLFRKTEVRCMATTPWTIGYIVQKCTTYSIAYCVFCNIL